MENSYPLNSLVWAKLSGHPWWPGYIKSKYTQNEFEIEYFGDFTRSFLSKSKIKPFCEASSNPDKRNPRLVLSYEMALRVFKGQSTIDSEKQNSENKISTKSKNEKGKSQADISQKSFTEIDQPLDFKKQTSGPLVLFRAKATRGNKKPNETKEQNKADRIFYDETPKNSQEEIKIKKINKKTARISKLRFTKQYRHNYPMETLNPIATPTKQIPQEVPHCSELSSVSDLDEDFARIKSIEEKVKQLANFLHSNFSDFYEAQLRLNIIRDEILAEERNMHRMYHTEIGACLMRIQRETAELQRANQSFRGLNESLTLLLKSIRKKLFINFFKTKDFDQKVIFSSSEMENIINVRRPVVSGLKLVSSNGKAGLNDKLEGMFFVDPRKIKRVCKKLAKVLYSKSRPIKLKKVSCETIAEFVEGGVRKKCKSGDQYDRQILGINGKLKSDFDDLVAKIYESKFLLQTKTKEGKIQSFLLGNTE